MSATALAKRPGLDELAPFEIRLALRGRGALVGAVAYAAAAATVAVAGLSAFRQLGLGAATPASIGLLELSVLLPPLVALVAGAAALHGEREEGLRAMLRAAGVPVASVLLAKLWALIVSSVIVVAAGYGAAALVLATALGFGDLAAFGSLLITTLLTTLAASSIGLLVSALARDRVQALVTSIGVWTALAIGVDLLLIAAAPVLPRGGVALAVAAVMDPIEAGRVAGLLALGADAHVLGAVGAYVEATIGAGRAVALLLAVEALWIVVPFGLACVALDRRERS